MKLELVIFSITGFLIYNIYYDNIILNKIKVNMKYIKMISYAFIGIAIYIMIKRTPYKTQGLMAHAYDFIRYMPIDKNTTNAFKPLFELTKTPIIQEQFYQHQNGGTSIHQNNERIINNLNNNNIPKNVKRCVSETKKKYVASRQHWKCGDCNNQLDHTYEIDHIKDLRYGGDNNVNNLVALCRNCHGKKTLISKINE
jgi:hypothetical protein